MTRNASSSHAANAVTLFAEGGGAEGDKGAGGGGGGQRPREGVS